jgi:hypothetical protein
MTTDARNEGVTRGRAREAETFAPW